MPLYVNLPTLFRTLRIRRTNEVKRKHIGSKDAWRFVDDFGRELPPTWYEDFDGEFAEAPSEGFEILDAVANFEGEFSLRKAQVRWGRNGGAAAGTDDAVTTHHFLKLAAGVPSDAWVAADFIAAETALTAFWDAIKASFNATTTLKQIRWYRVDPDVALSGPPVRVVDPAIAGGGTAGAGQSPPQVAISVTEKTSSPKNWGRFYLPAPLDTHATQFGRIGATFHTDLANAADVMYEAFVTASIPAVVYSKAKPARETSGGTDLPAQAATAFGVTSIQVDDLYDVIRSRRWNEPLLRLQRDIAGA